MYTKSTRMVMAACALGAMALTARPAYANAAAEGYVETNATQAMRVLAAAGSPDERSTKFGALMEQFADVPAITTFVLGSYARTVKSDLALTKEWSEAFRDYVMASYEDQLDRYRGSALRILGSRDTVKNGRECSAVGTEMTSKARQPLRINWYICRASAGTAWKVADVGLVTGDSEMKLAITQRAQFEAFLGANGGDVRKLIASVKAQTVAMRARRGGKHT